MKRPIVVVKRSDAADLATGLVVVVCQLLILVYVLCTR